MSFQLSRKENSVLYNIIAESRTDIILKTDRDGFIIHASPAIEQLGIVLPDLLVWPHILDLIDDDSGPVVSAAHQAAVDRQQPSAWIEFPCVANDGVEQWFAIRMRGLVNDSGETYGVLSVMRSIAETRALKEKLFAAELTDPLTGLTNRRAFISMLQYLVEHDLGGWLALFDIDYFKAINMRYGLSTGDQVLVAFSTFLKNLTDTDNIISRVGAQRFGILFPSSPPGHARSFCEDIVCTLAELGHTESRDRLPITASAGVARINRNLDTTIRTAELALFTARARGRHSVEMAA
ncbi:MAG TPA: GGDEF domain-containing protein [Novosphingobium sp.]|nr:GGDEF domain-containing protein [Novosphingobium sp.]